MGQFSVTMENILFNEQFPSNLEILSTTGLTGTNITGQTIKGRLPDIEYDEAISGVHKGNGLRINRK